MKVNNKIRNTCGYFGQRLRQNAVFPYGKDVRESGAENMCGRERYFRTAEMRGKAVCDKVLSAYIF